MKFSAIVLAHLGGVGKIDPAGCESFLREFLSDEEVLGYPRFFREFLARRIAQKRAGHFCDMLKSCAVFEGGKAEQASVFYAKSLAKKLEENLGAKVFEAGVYGENNLKNLRPRLEAQNLTGGKILFVVCYPQTASSTVFPALREIEKNFAGADYEILKGYGASGAYAQAVASSVLRRGKNFDAVLFSFHSVPLRQLKKHPYAAECEKSFEKISALLGGMRCVFAYQSAMKFGKWLAPSAIDAVRLLAGSGAKNIAVACPGFFCDCTETLVEINRELRAEFFACGGENFEYINCLNDSPLHVNMFRQLIKGLDF